MTNNAWPRFPHVYEINTRVWLRELSRREGRRVTLDTIPIEELEKVSQLGFHAIWLMGVWTTSTQPVEVSRNNPEIVEECRRSLPDMSLDDIIGSPYAIAKYDVSPELGGANGLRVIRQRMAQLGLRLMLDFVPNHFACDHEFTTSLPGVFVLGSEDDLQREPQNYFRGPNGRIFARGRDPYYAGWPDTVQINYAQPAGRGQMLSELLHVASQCDGVRCDMAMLILPDIHQRVWGHRLGENPNLNSFWKESITAVRERFPNFLFLAESYWDLEWRLQQEGFDFTYDKTLYDRLRKNDFVGVKQHLQAEPAFRDRCCHFIENHDEPRAAGAFGHARSRSAAVASFFVPGLRLLHEGQLEGHATKLSVHLGRRAQEKENIETAVFYEKMLSVLRDTVYQDGIFRQRAVHSAGWGDTSNDCIAAYEWKLPSGRNNGFNLVVINMSEARAYGRIAFDPDCFQPGKQYIFQDQFDGKKYEREGQELKDVGLYVALEPHQPHLFNVTQK